MKNPKIVFACAFTLLVIFGAAFLLSDKKESPRDSHVSSQASVPATSDEQKVKATPESDKRSNPGQYIEYSESNLANAKGQKILFFHAPWCPQCRSIEKTILEDKNSIPSGITILKVDYDSHQELRQKYGVTIQTTFVKINASGELIDKYVAYDEPTIESVRKNFLL
jgi:thiol-disulfide isomerase/thioredoxin